MKEQGSRDEVKNNVLNTVAIGVRTLIEGARVW